MKQFGSWVPYTGTSTLALATVLFAVTVALPYSGIRLRRRLQVQRTGKAIGFFLVVFWVLDLAVFGICIETYSLALFKQYGHVQLVSNPITTITVISGLVTFILIAFFARHHGFAPALGSAVVGTIAGPMIFEFPSDLIVGSKTYSPEPATLSTLLYFLPLILLELSSYSLLTLSPAVAVSRYTLLAMAGMFLVFSIWALFGFPHPSTPLPYLFNIISKILAFVTSITLFIPTFSEPQVEWPLHGITAS
jgi:hypothetical protein